MIVAVRVLKLREADREIDLPVRVFAPEPNPDGQWSCRAEIGWPDRTRTFDIGGFDGVQALLLALTMVGAELYTSDAHRQGRLRFERAGGGYGFPVPAILRDLLEGDVVVPVEGSTLPQTYVFERGAAASAIAERAQSAMRRAIEAEWPARAEGLPLRTPREAVILASIVEREAKLPQERPMIARVFLNRLRLGMRLQADPTAAYGAEGGLGVFVRRLDLDDLARTDGYNTYVVSGLPASPICSPGLASLTAVLHPASSDALYFVADGSGGHVFSATLAEHSANVARYRARSAAGAGAAQSQHR